MSEGVERQRAAESETEDSEPQEWVLNEAVRGKKRARSGDEPVPWHVKKMARHVKTHPDQP